MKLDQLVEKATQVKGVTIAVVAAEDDEVLKAITKALDHNLADFLLYGERSRILQLLSEINPSYMNHSSIRIVDTNSVEESAELAVKAVSQGDADVLMKGNISTSTLLKEVLNKQYGLRTGNVLSHVAVFEIPTMDRFIIVTDSAITIAPDLHQKVQIIKNSVKIARSIGISNPKVAPIAAVEVINPSMQATLDAAALTQMNKRGQIKNCIVDGPLALDNAISELAAKHKGIASEVAGNADILVVPAVEVGNVLYKSLIYFANAEVGAVIAGAKSPIVLTSRADSAKSKLYSIALAVCSVIK